MEDLGPIITNFAFMFLVNCNIHCPYIYKVIKTPLGSHFGGRLWRYGRLHIIILSRILKGKISSFFLSATHSHNYCAGLRCDDVRDDNGPGLDWIRKDSNSDQIFGPESRSDPNL